MKHFTFTDYVLMLFVIAFFVAVVLDFVWRKYGKDRWGKK